MKARLTSLFLCLLACVSATAHPCRTSLRFSFERGMEGWEARATDIDDPPVEWSVGPTAERARAGRQSLRLYLNNLNDAGKIWAQRAFTLRPNRRYRVTVRYAFASADYGELNNFVLITGVSPQPPQTASDLVFQGTTANGAPSDVGYRWLRKRFTFTATTGADGLLYVTIGVWGTFESIRTYYLDDVRVDWRRGPARWYPSVHPLGDWCWNSAWPDAFCFKRWPARLQSSCSPGATPDSTVRAPDTVQL